MRLVTCSRFAVLLQSLVLLCFLLPVTAWAQQQRVLFVSSNHPGFPTFFEQAKGLSEVMAQDQILLDIEFMDTKRFPSEENLRHFRQSLAYKLSHTQAYDAVITGDDNALRFAIAEQTGLFKNLPVVFLGVNDVDLALAQNNNPWVTGTIEKVSMQETLELMVKLHPHALSIVAVTDGTSGGQADLQSFYRMQEALPKTRLTHLSLADMSFENLARRLSELSPDQPVLLLSAYRDRDGRCPGFKDSLHFMTDHLSAPLYHLYDHGMSDGIVGGKLVSHIDQGRMAAGMTREILHGTPVGRLPVRTDSLNRYMFDYRQLQRFNLPLSQLPTGSSILNRPVPFYRKYNKAIFILATILTFGGGVAILLLGHLRQRLEVEEALRKSEENFRNIINFSPMGVLLYHLYPNDQLILTGSNTAAQAILKTDLDLLVGKTIEEAFPGLTKTCVPDQFRRVCSLGTPWHCQQIDYKESPIHGSYEVHAFQTAPRKMACFFWDITERIQAEQSIKEALTNAREAREQLETVLRSVSDGLLFTDLDNRIMLMSHSAEELLGTSLHNVFGMEVGQVIKNNTLMKRLQAVASDKQEEASVVISLPEPGTNKVQTVQASLAAVRSEEGLKRGVITLLRDISRERELDLMKTEFISTAAHELRTPLTSVIGFSEVMIQQGGLTEQQTEFLSIIHKKAEVLGKIVEDLLDLARIDTGQVIRLKKDWADVNGILARSVSDYQRVCKDHRFKTILPDAPIEMLVDDRKLFQVMENLLSNAVKFSPVDSLIQVTCRLADNKLYIAVNDQGIGMKPAQIDRMFDKFYRVDASNTAREGLGLGMAIVKSIVEAHNGRIWVTSKPNRGTTVTFTLPYTDNVENHASPTT